MYLDVCICASREHCWTWTYILSRQETHFSLLEKICCNLVSVKPPKTPQFWSSVSVSVELITTLEAGGSDVEYQQLVYFNRQGNILAIFYDIVIFLWHITCIEQWYRLAGTSCEHSLKICIWKTQKSRPERSMENNRKTLKIDTFCIGIWNAVFNCPPPQGSTEKENRPMSKTWAHFNIWRI